MISIKDNRLEQIVKKFQNKKIMIVGDIMLDEYLIGDVKRISPEAPVPIVEINNQIIKFGGAANVALNVSSLGCKPFIVGIVGNDSNADVFFEKMSEESFNAEGILRIEDRLTTIKTRIIGQSQHLVRLDKETNEYINSRHEEILISIIQEYFNKMDGIILQDYNKGVLTENIISFITNLVKDNEKLICVDPKFINFLKYKNVSTFKPNIKETEAALALKITNEPELVKAGTSLLEQLNAQSILITRGSQGMSLFESNGSITHVSTRARRVSDVSGAGDTVISTLTAALIGGATYKEAASLANYAAGIVCEEVGIVPIMLDKLKKVCLDNGAQ